MAEKFCIYCQVEFKTSRQLFTHIRKRHKGTYADVNIERITGIKP